MRFISFCLFISFSLAGIIGCASQKPYYWTGYSNRFISVDSTIHPDPGISNWLLPYHTELKDSLDKTIGYSAGIFDKGKPESSLGDLVADAIRSQASLKLGRYIDVGIFMNSGLQFHLPKGTVTQLEISEIVPEDSPVVLLKINGDQMGKLAEEIAEMNGQPVSGLRMSILNSKPRALIIGYRLIESDSTYLVVTSDNALTIFPALQHPVMKKMLDLSVRQAVENYIGNRMTIRPALDGRMRSSDE